MPIYEYRCLQCSHQFETLVRNSREAVVCPACHADRLERLMSAHAVGAGTTEPACGTGACAPQPSCGAGACPACL